MRFVLVVAGLAFVLVAYQAIQTLDVLDKVERERDTWQRPNDIVQALDLKAGESVVDFGSGAGYFALRLAPTVGPTGRVIAIDIRRQSLAFLWLRSLLRRAWQLDVVLSDARDPRLPPRADRRHPHRQYVSRAHQPPHAPAPAVPTTQARRAISGCRSRTAPGRQSDGGGPRSQSWDRSDRRRGRDPRRRIRIGQPRRRFHRSPERRSLVADGVPQACSADGRGE